MGCELVWVFVTGRDLDARGAGAMPEQRYVQPYKCEDFGALGWSGEPWAVCGCWRGDGQPGYLAECRRRGSKTGRRRGSRTAVGR